METEKDPNVLFKEFQTAIDLGISKGRDIDSLYQELCGYKLSTGEKLYSRLMVKLSIEGVSKYADYVTKRAPNKVALPDIKFNSSMVQDACAIGNIAYVAIHAEDKNVRDRYEAIFYEWRVRRGGKGK